jgi:uncharacterized protein
MSSLIINQDIVPRLKDGDLPGGIEAGVDSIVRQLTLPAAEAEAQALAAQPAVDSGGLTIFAVAGAFILFVFAALIMRLLLGSRGAGRSYRGSDGSPVTVWNSASSSDSSWSSSSDSSDSFSGGGGDFGGGGASGDW